MTISLLSYRHTVNQKKVFLNLQYKALKSGTYDKFETWIMTIEDRWTDEILDCLKGNFPDWRGQ